jgi:hypothetical protein
VMSGIITIQTTLSDMQLKLDTLVGWVTTNSGLTWTSTIDPTPVVTPEAAAPIPPKAN